MVLGSPRGLFLRSLVTRWVAKLPGNPLGGVFDNSSSDLFNYPCKGFFWLEPLLPSPLFRYPSIEGAAQTTLVPFPLF